MEVSAGVPSALSISTISYATVPLPIEQILCGAHFVFRGKIVDVGKVHKCYTIRQVTNKPACVTFRGMSIKIQVDEVLGLNKNFDAEKLKVGMFVIGDTIMGDFNGHETISVAAFDAGPDLALVRQNLVGKEHLFSGRAKSADNLSLYTWEPQQNEWVESHLRKFPGSCLQRN